MKRVFWFFLLLLFTQFAQAQHIYQIRADSVRIYNVCDTAELIIENRTRGVAGFLYNKGNGRTEFKRLRLETIGGNRIAITGQDTLDISTLPGISGVDTIYRDGDYVKYVKRGSTYTFYAPANETLQSVTNRGSTTTNPLSVRNITSVTNNTLNNGLFANGNYEAQSAAVPSYGFHIPGTDGVALYYPGPGTNLRVRSNGGRDGLLWSSDNHGAGSGLDADLLDGFNASVGATAASIPVRDPNGYLFANYFNTAAGTESATPTRIFGGNEDGYIRPLSAAAILAFLGMPGSGETLQSVTNRGNLSVRDNTNMVFQKASGTPGGLYLQFRNSDGSARGHIGYGSSTNNTFIIHNNDNSPTSIYQRLLVNGADGYDDGQNALLVNGSTATRGVFRQNLSHPSTESNGANQLWNSYGGAQIYADPEFRSGMNNLMVYNNYGGDAVKLFRENGTLSAAVPNNSGWYLRVQSQPGTSSGTQPGLGGVYSNLFTAENQVYVTRIRAFIPAGYTLNAAANQHGDNPKNYWTTSQDGVGKWQDYIHVWCAGQSGIFSSVNYYYLEGPRTDVTWYIAYFDTKQVTSSAWQDNVSQNPVTARPVALYLNDDNTKLEQGGGSSLKVQTPHGNMEIGAQNTGHAHFLTDRENFYFNKPLLVVDRLGVYNGTFSPGMTTYLSQTEGRINNNLIYHAGNLSFYTSGEDKPLKTEPNGYFGIENWIRTGAETGLFNNNGFHFFPYGTKSWAFRGGTGSTQTFLLLQTANGQFHGGLLANASGDIGIASSNDAWRLRTDVNGNAFVTGQVQATSFYQSSLRSLKKDIKPFTASALDVFRKAQVRSFVFRADSSGKTNIGFIADEVPDEMSTPGRKGVDQASTVALLVKSVQELEEKIKKLEMLITELSKEKNNK
ncbi:tail fiber domain-containing protein [Chitinophaga niabensis]|uniref:Chaperone of endosialidase n=1 Tax=Chitinophaga niabensis TaxID=536979 RepID=A0A1N6DEN7_9BACT|nr:tail fiber domain-containing protein [Chitinophaga niabensis]SIN69261.1 Chaperone of endosialidase [Chitinophaga niabensis]